MIGYHVSRSGKPIAEALKIAAADLGGRGFTKIAAQIFSSGPQSYKQLFTQIDITQCKALPIELVIHGAYVDNPWSKSLPSVGNFRQEMRTAHAIGATGVIVHLGSKTMQSLEWFAAEMNKLPADVLDSCIIWLEINATKSSDTSFETPAKLKPVFEYLSTQGLRVGLCIDTAHLYSCGYAFDSRIAAQKWLDQLDLLMGDIPVMFHLNDSATGLGSGKDQHEALTRGNIWRHYAESLDIRDSGLMAVLEYAEKRNCMVILERNDGLADDLSLIHNLGFFVGKK